MKHIFRVPVDTKHFKDTIEDGKSYEKELLPYLTFTEKEKIQAIAQDDRVRYWGSIAGESNQITFLRIQEGDEILFYRSKKYIGVATIVFTTINPMLARYSWGERKEKATWELMYFLNNVQLTSFKTSLINNAFGYKDNSPVMGFSMVSEEIAQQFLQAHGSVADFIKQIQQAKEALA